jgi:glycosyltransferase involved in cell wall biosynthesis
MNNVLTVHGVEARRRGEDFIYIREYPPSSHWLCAPHLELCQYIDFDVVALSEAFGWETTNSLLIQLCRSKKIHIVHFKPQSCRYYPSTFSALKQMNVFIVTERDDDHYSRFFKSVAKQWLPFSDFIISTSRKATRFYNALDISSEYVYPKPDISPRNRKKDIDVAFVGEARPDRIDALRELKRNGVGVRAWGPGWIEVPEVFGGDYGGVKYDNIGYVSNKDMIEIYSRARICVDCPTVETDERNYVPGRILLEVPLCGALPVTKKAEVLGEEFIQPGKEFIFFEDTPDLIQKVSYYLENDKERESIVRAAQRKAAAFPDDKQKRDEIWAMISNLVEVRQKRGETEIHADIIRSYLRALCLKSPHSQIITEELLKFVKSIPEWQAVEALKSLKNEGLSFDIRDLKEKIGININMPNHWKNRIEEWMESTGQKRGHGAEKMGITR